MGRCRKETFPTPFLLCRTRGANQVHAVPALHPGLKTNALQESKGVRRVAGEIGDAAVGIVQIEPLENGVVGGRVPALCDGVGDAHFLGGAVILKHGLAIQPDPGVAHVAMIAHPQRRVLVSEGFNPPPTGFISKLRKFFSKNLTEPLDFFLHFVYYITVAPADIAQPVERILGKDEVPSSNLGISSKPRKP